MSTATGRRNRNRGVVLAGIGAIVLSAMGAGVLFGAPTKHPRVEPVSSEAVTRSPLAVVVPTTAPAERAAVTAVLRVSPPTARVRVDGEQVEVIDGGVRVQERPGETVDVEVYAGDASVKESVVVTRDGRAVPPLVAVKVPTALAPVKHPPRPAGATGKPKAPEEPEPPPKPAGSSPTGPKFSTEW